MPDPRPTLRIPIDVPADRLRLTIGAMPGAALLEGGPEFGTAGRWSILAARPRQTFEATGDRFRIADASGTSPGWRASSDPLAELARWQSLLHSPGAAAHRAEDADAPPFLGGLIGFFGYDLATRFERLPRRSPRDSTMPDLWFGLYDTFAAIDHRSGEAALWAIDPGRPDAPPPEDRARAWLRELEAPAARLPRSRFDGPPTSNFSPDAFRAAIRRTIHYIHAGDIFQANLSQRFAAIGHPEPLDLYRRLRRRSPAPYSAFLRLDDGRAVVSSSPELFFETRGDRIVTRPIKGTRPRGASPEEDAHQMAALIGSAKDRAELAMIVDLLRNDLGRICSYGSVRVVEASAIESYATVHHQVATVEGKLREPLMPAPLLRAIFPGGSITGAPKIRAMEIIDELEPTRRSVYTGAIGYVGTCGKAGGEVGDSAFNIAIRTMLVEGNRVTYQVGGGIVADSDPWLEFEETMHKGRAMRDVLEGRA